MNSIGQHICYLLRHHDCVVLPGWGAFVAQRCPAVIDTAAGTVRPPVRVLGFNAAITHDDGLVASSVARRDRVGYEQAMLTVANAVEAMRRTVCADRELMLPGLGRFTLTSEDALEFDPALDNVVSLPLMSLPEVHITPVLEEAKAKAEPCRDTFYLPLSRNWINIAASLLVLVTLGLVLSTPIAIPDAARASLAAPAITFGHEVEETIELSEANRHGVLSIVIPQGSDAMSVVDTIKPVSVRESLLEPASTGLRIDASDSYCVIVASLASRELAQEFVDKADIPMAVLEKDGKYRVYAATGATSARALEAARGARLTERFPDAWVCRR